VNVVSLIFGVFFALLTCLYIILALRAAYAARYVVALIYIIVTICCMLLLSENISVIRGG